MNLKKAGYCACFLLFAGLFLALSSLLPNQALAQTSTIGGYNIDPTNNQAGIPSGEFVKNTNGGKIRFVYKGNVENSLEYYKQIADEYAAAGAEVIMVFNQESLWPAGEQITPQYVEDYKNKIREVADYMGGSVAAFEIWNEQDMAGAPTSMYIPPENYAALLSAAYEGVNEVSDARVIIGGLVSGDANYLRQVVNVFEQAGVPLPADGVGLHPYINNVDGIINMVNNYLQYTQGRPLWITEFGWQGEGFQPGQATQSDNTLRTQADFMQEAYEHFYSLSSNKVASALWFAWSDAMLNGFGFFDKSGNPKKLSNGQTLLEFFLAVAMKVTELPEDFDINAFLRQFEFKYSNPFQCTSNNERIMNTRPFDCSIRSSNISNGTCYTNIPNQTFSCATTPTVIDTITYSSGTQLNPNGQLCSDGQYYLSSDQTKWGGTVTIDPSNAQIPFVGKSQTEKPGMIPIRTPVGTANLRLPGWIRSILSNFTGETIPGETKEEAENRIRHYLAEYFEGTLYGPGYNYSDYVESELANYDELPSKVKDRSLLNEAGVYRKLAPYDVQNNLKKEVVQRSVATQRTGATSDPIRNYTINLDRKTTLPFFLKNLPFLQGPVEQLTNQVNAFFNLETAKLVDFESHLHPSITDPDYWKRFQDWRCDGGLKIPIIEFCLIRGKYAALWKAVPMFSREDNLGRITLSAQGPGSSLITLPEDISVPHTQRLYEATRNTSMLLTSKPFSGRVISTKSTSPSNIATAKEQPNKRESLISSIVSKFRSLLGNIKDKVVLAQTPPAKNIVQQPQVLQAESNRTFNIQVNARYEPPNVITDVYFVSSTCDGDVDLFLNGSHVAGTNSWNLGTGPFYWAPQWNGSPFRITPGVPLTITYSGTATKCEPLRASTTCTFTVDQAGNFNSTCGGAQIAQPVCGQGDLYPVDKCNSPADPGIGGDELCCEPVSGELTVTEIVPNPPAHSTESARTVQTKVQRDIEVRVQLPQLDEIWKNSVFGDRALFGQFNIKAAGQYDRIVSEDVPGESNPIPYTFSNGLEGINPTEGTIKYPHLAAMYDTKELVQKTLHPQGYVYQPTGQPSGREPRPSIGFTSEDIQNAITAAATKYGIPTQLLQAIFEIEGIDYIRNPNNWICKRNASNAAGLAQVVDSTYLTVTLPSERILDSKGKPADIGVYTHKDGVLSRCNTNDAFELMARVLLLKVGRLNTSTMTGRQGISITEKNTIYQATYGYYGSYKPDSATRGYNYNLPYPKRRSGDGYCQIPIVGGTLPGCGGMNYSDIVCNKLGHCQTPSDYPHGFCGAILRCSN